MSFSASALTAYEKSDCITFNKFDSSIFYMLLPFAFCLKISECTDFQLFFKSALLDPIKRAAYFHTFAFSHYFITIAYFCDVPLVKTFAAIIAFKLAVN